MDRIVQRKERKILYCTIQGQVVYQFFFFSMNDIESKYSRFVLSRSNSCHRNLFDSSRFDDLYRK